MLSDNHMHTYFSADSETMPEQMIKSAVNFGMESICITDHMDKDYYVDGIEWVYDLKEYFKELIELQEKYKEQICIRIGMECGMQVHLGDFYKEIIKDYPFDYIIGSVHNIGGKDPYYPEFFEGRSDKAAYRDMFQETIKNLQNFDEFDALGHLDYVVRYGKNKEKEYFYRDYADEIDEILRFLIVNGKGLEFNTAGWKYGLSFAHPHPDILKRYKELGGEIIVLGSDAHKPEHVGYDFQKAREYLCANGFKYCTEFRCRKPFFSVL